VFGRRWRGGMPRMPTVIRGASMLENRLSVRYQTEPNPGSSVGHRTDHRGVPAHTLAAVA